MAGGRFPPTHLARAEVSRSTCRSLFPEGPAALSLPVHPQPGQTAERPKKDRPRRVTGSAVLTRVRCDQNFLETWTYQNRPRGSWIEVSYPATSLLESENGGSSSDTLSTPTIRRTLFSRSYFVFWKE